MGTDTRKKIFTIVISADDYLDAAQKLLKLKLNRNQTKDIAVVIVECASFETKYN